MANSITVNGSLQISGDGASVTGSKSVAITQTGTAFQQSVQAVTAAAAIPIGDLSDIRYCYLHNSATAQTVTVTAAGMILKPGDIMLFVPTSTAVTLQATGSANVNTLITEA